MKPKEKANYLVQKFSKLEKGLDEKEWFKKEVSFNGNNKQCALICVDEIINCNTIYMEGCYVKYWEKVKQKINKL
tara:strand:+ start:324 stop:548 length:225 start_codon:yes stop_codon:yes gene_type:complete